MLLFACTSLAACGGGSSGPSPAAKQKATALLESGLTAEEQGQLAQADADYLAAVKQDPKETPAWYDLGLIAQQHGYAKNAEHDYEEALRADRHYVPALYNLGTLVAPKSPSSAARLYDEVISLQPKNAKAHLNLGFALQAEGKTAKGTAQITYAINLDPSLGRPRAGTTATPGS